MEYNNLLMIEFGIILLSALTYFSYTAFIGDEFGLSGRTRFDTAQNCLYFAVSVAMGFGSRQFEASTPQSRGLVMFQMIFHFSMLRYAIIM